MTDDDREREISELGQKIISLYADGSQIMREFIFCTMARLISGRSDEQIRQMERWIGKNG